jgi:hypothetical protein
MECIKQLIEEKEMKFKPLSMRSNSQMSLSSTLPPVKSLSKAKITTLRPKLASMHSPSPAQSALVALSSSPSASMALTSPSKLRPQKVLLLNGKITSK